MPMALTMPQIPAGSHRKETFKSLLPNAKAIRVAKGKQIQRQKRAARVNSGRQLKGEAMEQIVDDVSL